MLFHVPQSSSLKAQCIRLESSSKADKETDGHKEEQRKTGVMRGVMLVHTETASSDIK